MTVAELIAALQGMDQDMQIVFLNDYFNWAAGRITRIEVDRVEVQGSGYAIRQDGDLSVVVIS